MRDNIAVVERVAAHPRVEPMIKGVHTMFYSSEPETLRAFLRDELGFSSSGAFAPASPGAAPPTVRGG